MDLEVAKRATGDAAAALVEGGMSVGLGTGTTARWFIEAVGSRVAAGLHITAVATSLASAALAARHGIPLVELGGSTKIGDEVFNEVFHPIAVRLLEKCDAVLRVGGPSAGADEMVRVGRSLGLAIYTDPTEIPAAP